MTKKQFNVAQLEEKLEFAYCTCVASWYNPNLLVGWWNLSGVDGKSLISEILNPACKRSCEASANNHQPNGYAASDFVATTVWDF